MIKFIALILYTSIHVSTLCQSMTYAYKNYEADEGMLSSEVFSTLKDSRGFMWFGSDNGIAKFNGYEFEYFTVSDGLTHNSIFHFYEDPLGRIWYSSFMGGIGYIENNIVKPYPYNHLLIESFSSLGWVDQMEIDHTGKIRFNFSREKAGEIDANGNFHLFEGEEQTLLFPLLGLSDELDIRIVLKNDSVFLLRKNKIEKFLETAAVFNFLYNFPLSENASIFQCNRSIIYVDEDTSLFADRNISNSAFGIDNQGRIWSSEGRNGVEIYENIFALFNNEAPQIHFFRETKVSQIIDDENGGMWLTTINQGIYHIYNYQLENYKFEGQRKTQIRAVCRDEQGGLFYACDRGELVYIDTSGEHQIFLENQFEVTQIEKTSPTHLGISAFLLNKIEPEKLIDFEISWYNARGFYWINDSVQWLLSGTTIIKTVNDSIVYRSSGNNFYRVITEDQDGKIWLGGNHGISYWEENDFINANHLLNDEVNHFSVKDIKSYKNNLLLVVSANKGVYFLVKNAHSYQSYHIPITDRILEKGELDIADSVLWLASNKGVSKIKFNSDFTYDINQITYWRGLASNEVNDIELMGDYVYAATNKGLSKFHKNGLALNETPIKLYINSLLVNGKEYFKSDNITLSHRQNNIQISFIGLSFRTSENTKYKYKLLGLDEQWQYTQNREIRYQNLAPASYQFQVAASNENGIWSENEVISFSISKPIWKTRIFIALVSVIALLIGFIWYRWRIKRRNLLLQEEREKERNKRKIIEAKLFALRSQMNPHFTFNALNAIQNVMINFSPKEATSYMTSFSVLIRKILQSSEELYISLDEELEMLRLYIELENLRFNNSIQFNVTIDPTIDCDFEEIPSMIIQPFVENAIIHGLSGKETGVKRIAISIQFKEDDILCQIIDNGIGREAAAKTKLKQGISHESFGIKITEERLKLFSNRGGNEVSYKITDCYDENRKATGTKVEILFRKKLKSNG